MWGVLKICFWQVQWTRNSYFTTVLGSSSAPLHSSYSYPHSSIFCFDDFEIITLGGGGAVWPEKIAKFYKSCPKMVSLEKYRFWSLYENCLRMWEIWENKLLPKALKSCPKSNKLPDQVTLLTVDTRPMRPNHLQWKGNNYSQTFPMVESSKKVIPSALLTSFMSLMVLPVL